MYYKQCTGAILAQKSTDDLCWFRWQHHSEGKAHCEECLMLDGCFFTQETHPPCPHHPFCHCTLEPIDYAFVLASASAHSDYSKFDPYLFNTTGTYPHNKEKLFNAWGYTVDDAQWLQAEFAQQARKKYLSGNYALGMLNKFGQRINIEIELPRRDKVGIATFISGWMVAPNGRLNLITPYGGK